MASDIALAVGDGSRRMTYAELAQGTEAHAGLGHLRAFEKAIETLREQLTKAERRADEAEEAERHAMELVKYVTAEASEQRKRADDARTAEQIARDEAAGLRTRLDQLQARGLWARLRNKR